MTFSLSSEEKVLGVYHASDVERVKSRFIELCEQDEEMRCNVVGMNAKK